MGLNVTIKLKQSANRDEMNAALKALGLEEEHLPAFQGKEYHQWNIVDYYNQSTEEAVESATTNNDLENVERIRLQATSGEDRPATYEEYKAMFGPWMLIDTLSVDIGFSRCSEESMQAIVYFVIKNHENIEWIDNGGDLLERCGLEYGEVTASLFNAIEKPAEEPTLLPEDERTSRDIQGGFPLIYWSPAPNDIVYAAYGNVERPTFMKDRQYQEDWANSLYKTDDGRGVLLLPLAPFGDSTFHERVWKEASDMGVTDNFAVFCAMVYPSTLQAFHGGEKIVGVAESIIATYPNFEVIKERFVTLVGMSMTVNGALDFNGRKRFEAFSYDRPSAKNDFRLSVINALYYAMKKLDRDGAFNTAMALSNPKITA